MPILALGSRAGGLRLGRRSRLTRAHTRALPCVTRMMRLAAPDPMFAGVTDAQDPTPALKRQLADAILARFDASGQFNIASRLGVDQPRASNLCRGRLERFSLQQLVRFAARVDGEVTISVAWTSRRLRIIPRVAARPLWGGSPRSDARPGF